MATNNYVGTSADNSWQVVNPGTFTLDGLGGVDTLALGTSLRSSYTVTQGADGSVHVDSVSGASAALHATLHNMEVLTFNSGRDVLDLRTYFGAAAAPAAATVSTLSGTASNDTLSPGAGRVTLDGLAGVDTVVLPQSSSSYTLAATTTGFTLSSKDGQSAYTLSNIERIQFGDDRVALDLGPTGHAAQAVKVLGAVFGPSSVGNTAYVGIALQYLDNGMSYTDLMGLALGVALPGAPSNSAVVGLLYKNVIGSAPTQAQAQPFVDMLASHAQTTAQLGVMAADTPYNESNVGLTGVLAQTGVHYA